MSKTTMKKASSKNTEANFLVPGTLLLPIPSFVTRVLPVRCIPNDNVITVKVPESLTINIPNAITRKYPNVPSKITWKIPRSIIVNTSTSITYIRLVLIGMALYFLTIQWSTLSIFCFSTSIISDVIGGKIVKQMDQTTRFGFLHNIFVDKVTWIVLLTVMPYLAARILVMMITIPSVWYGIFFLEHNHTGTNPIRLSYVDENGLWTNQGLFMWFGGHFISPIILWASCTDINIGFWVYNTSAMFIFVVGLYGWIQMFLTSEHWKEGSSNNYSTTSSSTNSDLDDKLIV